MKRMDRYALVTGAGSGLGNAISIELAGRGINLILLSKKGEGLDQLSGLLSDKFRVKVKYLEIDFLKHDSMIIIKEFVKDIPIDILINNAGLGGSMYFDQTDIDYIDSIIQINVRVLVLLTKMLMSKLKQNYTSYILNVASMAGCCPIAYKTVYPASKAFVYSFSKSIAYEFKSFGTHVCVLIPGAIKTNKEVCLRIEQQSWWVKAGLKTPDELARIGIDAMFQKKKVVIPGVINKINWLLLKILPKSLSIPLVSHAMKNEIDRVAQLAMI